MTSASRSLEDASETEVRVGQVLMTCDLDLEVRIGVAVDVALDDGEVSVGASLEAHRELTRRGEGRTGDQREALVPSSTQVGVDRRQRVSRTSPPADPPR